MGTHGGFRGGGRPKGAVNKATRDIKELAQKHGPDVIRMLLRMVRSKKTSEATRVAAGKELLDRGYGKAAQSLEVGGTINVVGLLEAARQRAKR